MPLSPEDLQTIGSYESLALVLNRELDWPEGPWDEFRIEDLYGLNDLGNLHSLSAINLKGQEWGIFLADFGEEKLERKGLGKALKALAEKARENRPWPTWPIETILFICRSENDHWTFARYSGTRNKAKLETFGWDDPRHSRTVVEFNLAGLDWNKQDEWHKAWDVKRVVRNFYTRFRDIFEAHEEDVVIDRNKGKGKPKKMPAGEQRTLFLQRITNRLLFLAFLQKKRWLEVDGHKPDYLFHLYDRWKADPQGRTFFQVLRVLFFNVLNEPDDAKRATVEPIVGNGPYLNGGLFHEEAHEDESKWDSDGLAIPPDELFEDLLGEKGLFRQYNFTAIENYDETDQDVAVDPEMLGKIFEELVTDRHDGGSYYTPRPIVAFMCQEALRGYLETEGFENDATLRLVAEREPAGFDPKDFRPLLQALARVRVVDPACGSGAYLVGMLHEIITLIEALEHRFEPLEPHDEYQRKLNIIKNSIYGVDLKDFAVNIARLRMWLSLAVEFRGKNPPPLPNLDFKIETGDALLGPSPEAIGQLALGDDKLEEITKKKAQFMKADPEDQDALESEIREMIDKAKSDMPNVGGEKPFYWLAEFCEVFETGDANRDGFDIVIANPPYVRQELIKDIKPYLKSVYGEFYSGTADLYTYFYCRAVQLLRTGGMLSFISSNKWFKAVYGEELRGFLASQTSIRSITNFGDLPVFTATAYPMIFVARKESIEVQSTILTLVRTLDPPYPDVKALVEMEGFLLPTDAIQGSVWRLADKESLSKLRRMEQVGIPLGKYVKGNIYRGILTGYNKAFMIDDARRDQLIASDPKSADLIRPLAFGKDIRRWVVSREDQWVLFIPWHCPWQHEKSISGASKGAEKEFAKTYPAVYKYLKSHRAGLEARNQAETGIRYEWYALQRWGAEYYREFDKPRIVFPDIAKEARFAFAPPGLMINDTSFMIVLEDLYLVGITNSLLFLSLVDIFVPQIQNGFYRFKRAYLEPIPVPKAGEKDRKAISDLVQKCLDAKSALIDADVSDHEAKIDRRVEYLYFHQDEFDTFEAWQEHLKTEKHRLEQDTRALIKEHEGKQVELKETLEFVDRPPKGVTGEALAQWRSKKQADCVHGVLKTIVAFLNSKGGTLLIGVHDNGTIPGIEPDYKLCGQRQDWDGFVQKLVALVKDRIAPLYHELEPLRVRLDGKTVCRIDIEPSKTPRYLDGVLYIRLAGETIALEGRELEDWLRDREDKG
ncbi:MAG: putative DNA binding domain-containing protein [Armatimonadetes bacterium]|nr:putative DNA binding domain-containing protein [Armatimonadota bacterium]